MDGLVLVSESLCTVRWHFAYTLYCNTGFKLAKLLTGFSAETAASAHQISEGLENESFSYYSIFDDHSEL
jgi:hypothetical protein